MNGWGYWLRERLRDLWLWPFNLLRDLPLRAARISRTLALGVVGGAAYLRRLPADLRGGDGRDWLLQFLLGGGRWAHLLLVQLFDLLGGPELLQFLMHLGMHTTPLTAREKQIMVDLIGHDGLRLGEVRVAQGGILRWIFNLNGGLAFATWMTVHFPQEQKEKRYSAAHGRENRAILVHELMHLYQYQRVGSRYLTEAIYILWRTRRRCYEYGGVAGLMAATAAGHSFATFNREQQAQIVQDYFTRLRAGQDVRPYLPFLLQCRAGIL